MEWKWNRMGCNLATEHYLVTKRTRWWHRQSVTSLEIILLSERSQLLRDGPLLDSIYSSVEQRPVCGRIKDCSACLMLRERSSVNNWKIGRGNFLEWWNFSESTLCQNLNNIINLLKITELYTYNCCYLILCKHQ